MSQTLGIVGGVGIATATGGIAAGYYATAAAVVVLAVPYVLGSRDIAAATALRPAFSLGDVRRAASGSRRAGTPTSRGPG